MALQTHCHLALTLGGTPEFAPAYKWAVVQHLRIPEVILAMRRSATGKLHAHRLRTGSTAIEFVNFRLVLRVAADYSYTTLQRRDQIEAMLGNPVYFVDVDHAADGADHTADVKAMFLSRMSPLEPYTTMMERYDVEIELTDNYTVT